MSTQHNLVMASQKYPDGLRIFECQECRYAFAAEVDQYGVFIPGSKVMINSGNSSAAHAFFHTPNIDVELAFSAKAESKDKRSTAFGD
ncbi:MAG: hypothetical protein KC419_23305 [Anaerolineales bacterium]|nr:hypothetical protein [Anaerolineales bacterium]MCA9931441.1 hypothetical protein [Anaerolineales bacterium]